MSPSTVREGSWPDQLTLFGASLDAVTQVRLAGLSDTLTTGSIQSSARGERLDVAMEANDIDVGRYRVILITATGQAIGGPAFAVTPRREIASYMTSKGLVELREATDRILVRFRGDVPEQSADDLLLRVTGDRGREAGCAYRKVHPYVMRHASTRV
jgi:hypothetical protein